jgi:ketosteroid isomerase-like protein
MEDTLAHMLIGEADQEIVAVEEELRRAQLDADIGALDRLLAEDLLFTGPDGLIGTKAQDLAAHASGQVRFRRHAVEELRIRRVASNVAITALCTQLVVEVGGTTVRGRFRYTRVWMCDNDGSWCVVGGHVAAVPGEGGASAS